MSKIKINNLNPVGLELFLDAETFLNELSVQDIEKIKGGLLISQVSMTAGFFGAMERDDNYTDIGLGINLRMDIDVERSFAQMTFSVKTYVF